MPSLERCPTGVEGLDEITGGGFLRGSLVLIAGHPGSGKSTLAAKFVYEGAVRYGEPGAYVSFTEPKERFYSYMKDFGMDLGEIERKGLLKYVNLPTVVPKEALKDVVEAFLRAADEVKAKRIVLDSLTTLTYLGSPLEARALLHNTLMNLANYLKATILVIVDLPLGERKLGLGVEEFISDAVILLRSLRFGRYTPARYIEVVKMRGTHVARAAYEYSIEPGRGVVVYPPLKPLKGERYIKVAHGRVDAEEKISTGVEGLDALLGGGLIKGTSTLIAGPSGTGKTLLALTIAAEAAMKGMRVHYITYEEPIYQLTATLRVMGYDAYALKRNLTMASLSPHEISPGTIRSALTEAFIKRGLGQDLVVVDGLSTLKQALGGRAFLAVAREACSFFKAQGMTSIQCLAEDLLKGGGGGLNAIVDNLIALSLRVEGGVLKRYLTVVKARMEAASPKEHEVVLVGGRPVIKA